MNLDHLKQCYGEEYPAFALIEGQRVPLASETRFSRTYNCLRDGQDCRLMMSRLMDGSASITFDQLRQEWPAWSSAERSDFCWGCEWLNRETEFPDILRFIMEHGAPSDWSAIALSVAGELPRDEAYDLLLRALNSVELSRACNFVQALAYTKHPAAEARLRAHLAALWKDPALWDDDPFTNWFAFGATLCIKHLIELGAPPDEFEDHVRRLTGHACAGNRQSCRHLAPHYPWLPQELGKDAQAS